MLLRQQNLSGPFRVAAEAKPVRGVAAAGSADLQQNFSVVLLPCRVSRAAAGSAHPALRAEAFELCAGVPLRRDHLRLRTQHPKPFTSEPVPKSKTALEVRFHPKIVFDK